MTKLKHSLNRHNQKKIRNNLLNILNKKRVPILITIATFILITITGMIVLRPSTHRNAQPKAEQIAHHPDTKPLPEPSNSAPVESAKEPEPPTPSTAAPAPQAQSTKPTSKVPFEPPAQSPFTIDRIFGNARAYCVGTGNPVMDMGSLSIWSHPPQQPTPVNWQVEFTYEGGGIQIVDSGSYTAQVGERTRDFPHISDRAINLKGHGSAMRFRITSPNEITTDWTYAGVVSCN